MNPKQNAMKLGLLREGFRQCQMVGILSLIIMNLAAILVPLYIWIKGTETYSYYYSTNEVWSAWNGNTLALFTIPVAFLMALMLFHFLDNRAASDLYHALPHKRVTLYVSYVGAILLWALLLIVSSTLVSLFMCSITPNITLLTDTILPYTTTIFAVVMLVVAGTMIGMSLSGTVFTNVLLTVIILFFPRLCVWFLRGIITGNMPFIPDTVQEMSEGNNLLFSMAGTLFNSTSASGVFSLGWKPLVYTVVLALVYFCIGAILFCRRRSEAAGQSAPSRMLQHIYRILVTMIYCMFVTGVLASDIESAYPSGGWFEYLVLYLIAILIYFVYELITTRKWRNLLTALPGLGVVAVLNGALLLGMHTAYQNIVSQRPAASEIVSVSIEGGEYYGMDSDSYMDYASYVSLACQDIEIKDPTVISLVSYALNENMETWEEDPDQYYNKYYNTDHYETTHGNEKYSYEGIRVIIRTEDKELERLVYLSGENMEQLMQSLQSEEEFTQAWRNPPEPVDGSLSIDEVNYYYNHEGFSDEDVREIYDCYREELQTVPFADLYEYMSQGFAGELTLSYTFHAYGRTAEISCPISAELTPNTVQLYYDKISEIQQDGDLERMMTLLSEDNPQFFSLSLTAYQYDESKELVQTMDAYLDSTLDTDIQAIQAIAPYILLDGNLTIGEDYADICVTPYYDENAEDWEQEMIYLKVPIDSALFSDDTLLKNNDVYVYDYSEE